VKSTRLFLAILFFISFCSDSSTPISISSLNDITGSTTNKIEISNSDWDKYIGKSSSGNFIALRVGKDIVEDGVLIVFTKENLRKGIRDGGRVMNPLDRNVIDKMSNIGILSMPEKILSLQENIESEKFTISFNVQGDFHNSDITKIDFTNHFTKYTSGLLPSFFVESIGDEIYMFGGQGNVVKMNMIDGSVEEVETNLNQIIKDQEYTSVVKGSDYSSRMGLRDSSFDKKNNLILITAIKKDFEKNCFTLGVLSSELNSKSLNFSWVYNINDCYENFNSHHAGGRIKQFNEGYLLTVGDFKLPEDFKLEIEKDSDLGKVLYIDKNWNSTIFSSGHRNPQGLIIKNETILSTEHGPFGGDEFNIVVKGKDYGWPSSAYGFTYSLENIYELDHGQDFEEPIYFFTPSIGISELTIYEGKEFPRWNDFVLITSLKDMTVYSLKLDSEGKGVIHVGEMYIGERIRDITLANDGRLVMAGDLGSLIIASRTEKDIP